MPESDKGFGRTIEHLMEVYVTPEVVKRQERGELPKPLDLRGAQIIFYSDGRELEVRVNSEVRAVVEGIKYKPGVSKKAGDPVYEHEIEGAENIYLADDEDPDCGHATWIKIGEAWLFAFDFRYNKGLSKKHIETAEEFYAAAVFSCEQENWSPFCDNLFSCVSLLARSILLSLADPKFVKKGTHKGIQTRFNRFAHLGNIDPAHRDVFNKLSGLRDRARYLRGPISMSKDEGRKILKIVEQMMRDAKLRVE